MGHNLSQPNWDSVAQLPHLFAAGPGKAPVVGESHNPGDFTNGHVSNRAVVSAQDRLTAGNAMNTGLYCLSWRIKVVRSMTGVFARARPAIMMNPFRVLYPVP
jgi:hypothetical protein